MKTLDLFKKMLLTIAGSILVAFMCYSLSVSGKISSEFAIVATLIVQVVFTSENILWFGDNSNNHEFTEFSRSVWTSLLLIFGLVTYFVRDTPAVAFILYASFTTLVMAVAHWVVWAKRNVSFKVSLKG